MKHDPVSNLPKLASEMIGDQEGKAPNLLERTCASLYFSCNTAAVAPISLSLVLRTMSSCRGVQATTSTDIFNITLFLRENSRRGEKKESFQVEEIAVCNWYA